MKLRTRKAEFYAQQLSAQRRWIEDHGGSLAAYVERYGAPERGRCYGNGGFAIYAADMNALADLERIARKYA